MHCPLPPPPIPLPPDQVVGAWAAVHPAPRGGPRLGAAAAAEEAAAPHGASDVGEARGGGEEHLQGERGGRRGWTKKQATRIAGGGRERGVVLVPRERCHRLITALEGGRLEGPRVRVQGA